MQQVDQLIDKLPETATTAAPKSLKASKAKLKELWPTIKPLLTYASIIIPKKWRPALTAFMAAMDVLLGEESI